MIHTRCIWHIRLQWKVVVQKIRNFSNFPYRISLPQPHALNAACVNHPLDGNFIIAKEMIREERKTRFSKKENFSMSWPFSILGDWLIRLNVISRQSNPSTYPQDDNCPNNFSSNDICPSGDWPLWPDLAKCRHFANFFKVIGNFSMVYLVFAKNIEPTLEIICAMCTFSL